MNDSKSSQASSSECYYSTPSDTLQYIKTVIYVVLLTVALFGNTSVIWIVYRNKRMHTATNFLILNMAVGDLLMAIFNMIPTAISMLRNNHAWISANHFGQASCKLVRLAQAFSMACSIFTLTVLALERFFAVVFPMKKVLKARTAWLIFLICVASLAATSPLLYASRVDLFEGVPYCYENWEPAFNNKRASSIFTAVSFALLYALPLLLITALYSIIIAKVWFRHIPGNSTPENVRLLNKAKRKVLKMLITVVLAFALCWFILHLNLLLLDFTDVFETCNIIPIGLQTTGFLLGHANSSINCCIYPVFSNDYRRGFREILSPLLLRRNETLFLNRSHWPSMEASMPQSSCKGSPRMKTFKIMDQTRC